MSKITPPEGVAPIVDTLEYRLRRLSIASDSRVAPIVDTLEYLRDVKQLALESGDDTLYRFNFNFQVGE